MKQIDLQAMMINNGMNIDRKEILGMEFIKMADGKYLIKGSNGYVVDEKEKLQLENKELVIKDVECSCAKEITKQISKNKKRIKELDEDIKETEPTKE